MLVALNSKFVDLECMARASHSREKTRENPVKPESNIKIKKLKKNFGKAPKQSIATHKS